MKITSETNIKDLIPEGYELDSSKSYSFMYSNKNIYLAGLIPLKQKQEKKFELYINEYHKELIHYISSHVLHGLRKDVLYKSKNIPFWYKIGLLKFICDDLKNDTIDFHIHHRFEFGEWKDELLSICPKEFLESIFE